MISNAKETIEFRIYMNCVARCPYCNINNKIYLGPTDDDTLPTIEACQCHKCSNKFWLKGFKEDCEMMHDGSNEADTEDLIEFAYLERGEQ